MTPSEQMELALQRHQVGQLAEAEAIYRQILAAEPGNARAIHFMGLLLHQRGNTAAGIDLMRRSIALHPSAHDFYSNLGVVLTDCGLLSDAGVLYQQAIKLAPNDPEYHWNYSVNLLTAGNLLPGWDEFEWRLRSPLRHLNRGFPQPQWNGEDLSGKTILLHAEGGLGDAIQFVRYPPMVAERGGRMVLECQPELLRLFGQIPGMAQIVPQGDALPTFDFQIPLQSLPRVFQTSLGNIPASIPYLAATRESAEFWREKLSGDAGRKVGLAWAGSAGGRRSNSVEIFAPLGKAAGVRFYSLQKGPQGRQPMPMGLALLDYTEQIRDFADLAGLIANLDLVISVDTSIAHLAGAMGKSVWTLVASVPDFRWMRDREDSPWYPTMRLIRQKVGETWAAVGERIARELGLWSGETVSGTGS